MTRISVKMILSLVSAAIIFCSSTLNGQIIGGIKVDANMSNFFLSDMDGVESKLGFGVSVGGYTKIKLTNCLGLQPEVLLHYKTSTIEQAMDEVDYQYFGVEIPIYTVGETELWGGKGFVGIGPYIGVGIDARYKSDLYKNNPNFEDDYLDLYKEYGNEKSAMQRFDFGAGLMLGYEFTNRLQILATYKIGFIDALNSNKDNASMTNQTISLGLGYRLSTK